jgi:hypothetical protein
MFPNTSLGVVNATQHFDLERKQQAYFNMASTGLESCFSRPGWASHIIRRAKLLEFVYQRG